jgi:hypothetical protein
MRIRECRMTLVVATVFAAGALACTRSSGSDRRVVDATQCADTDAARTISGWFQAVESGNRDSVRKYVEPHFQGVSVNSFADGEAHAQMKTFDSLFKYVERRSRAHERLKLLHVAIGYRHGDTLGVGPIDFERRADDLGRGTFTGIGKGEVRCGGGVVVLGVGPSPFLATRFRPDSL